MSDRCIKLAQMGGKFDISHLKKFQFSANFSVPGAEKPFGIFLEYSCIV